MSERKIITLECAGCTAPLSEAIVATGVHRCPFCGYVNILPKEEQSSEVMHYLYSGDAELKDYDFERAYNAYSKAAELDEKESKAYFGMALAANRIKYIKDIVNNRWQAICCEVTDKKFAEDKNYLRALEIATPEQKEEYTSRAKEIDYIREKFAELEASGLDYDTFICVKVSDGQGGFTQDSMWANKLYDSISQSGAKPFYSEKEIGSRVGADYEALILYALHKSESMIIVCSDEEYLRTPWIQNEYTRYYAMMNEQEKLKNSIMIAFTGHPVERIPGIPGRIQGADLHDYASSQKINDFVNKFANAEERARKKAEEKAKAEAERKAKEDADEKARLALQAELENLKKQMQGGAKVDNSPVKYCTKCGTKNPINVKFCSDCGNTEFSDKNEKVCIACGASNPFSTKFCSDCGKTEFVNSREKYNAYIAEKKAKEEAERIAKEKAEAERKARQAAARAARKKAEQERVEREKAEVERKAREEAARKEAEKIFLARVEAQRKANEQKFENKLKKIKKSTWITLGVIVSIIFTFFVLIAIFGTTASDYEYTVSNGEITITKYIGTDSIIEIPSEIDGYPVTGIGYNAFAECTSLESITIPNSVTSIGLGAFFECTSLRSITIPDSVTVIGTSAFAGCSSLTIYCEAESQPSGWDSNWNSDNRPVVWGRKLVDKSAFAYIVSNNSVIITGYNGIDTKVVIPNKIDGYPVTGIEYNAFAECTSLEGITIPNSVTSIGFSAFLGCTSLKSVTIPDSVTEIGGSAFRNCTSLESITIPNSITKIGYNAFAECTSLKSVTIPDSVTEIGGSAFRNCTLLKSVTIGDSVTSIGEYAFYECKSLKSITIPDSVTKIEGSAFRNCTSLESVTIPNSVTSIGPSAFSGCASLESITIPDSITEIGERALKGCSLLTIYCEAESQPSGWNSDWNPDNRPVIWKHTHTYSDGSCTVCGAKEPYTKVDDDTILFGSYPQTEVTDSSLKSTLNSLAGTKPTISNSQQWTSYGYYISGEISDYMWYIDVEHDGERYRGVYFDSYRPYYGISVDLIDNSHQANNGYTKGSIYWFKYEPISWTILKQENGRALILCNMIIDSQELDYKGRENYSNNYAESTIRAWLNDTFYNTAFSELQKDIIVTTTVDNSVESTGYTSNSHVCENTNDNVFLLSYKELTTYLESIALKKQITDYAFAQGAYTTSGNGCWWLRSPDNYFDEVARFVGADDIDSAIIVLHNDYGVVPALQIQFE